MSELDECYDRNTWSVTLSQLDECYYRNTWCVTLE